MDVKRMTVGMANCIVQRVSYTADLGYEIFTDHMSVRHLWDILNAHGQDLGLRPFGMRAMMSLRLDKWFGSWSREFSPDYTPCETGLDRFIRWNKEADWIGKAAATAEAAARRALDLDRVELHLHLVHLLLDGLGGLLGCLHHLFHRLHVLDDLADRFLRAAVEHAAVVLVEQCVLDARVARALAALDHDHVLRHVGVEDRHAVDRARLVGARDRVHHVIGADHQRHVGLGEVVVDLLEVEDLVVGNAGLGEQQRGPLANLGRHHHPALVLSAIKHRLSIRLRKPICKTRLS